MKFGRWISYQHLTFPQWVFLNADKHVISVEHYNIMARISEYNVSFQEDQLLRRKVLNITESKTKRPPFFLPHMNPKKTSTKSEKWQQPEIGLDVRGQGVKADGKGYGYKTRQKQKRMRKHRNKVNSFPSPSNKVAAHKIPGFSLPPIDSKSLKHNPATAKNDPRCPSTTVITPQQEFEIVLTTLMSVIERSKEEQKRTAERFQRSIVQGKQKPINEKLQWPGTEEAKTGCSTQRC